jgi:hypothetical protein
MFNIEDFILNLNIFNANSKPLGWHDRFGISWTDWNQMHYLLSLVPFDYLFSDQEKEFMKQNIDVYSRARIDIQDLQDTGVLVSGIPIKLHTLKQKAQIINNISQCLEYYNNWIGTTQPINAIAYSPEVLTNLAQIEHSSWVDNNTQKSLLTHHDISPQKLLGADLKLT